MVSDGWILLSCISGVSSVCLPWLSGHGCPLLPNATGLVQILTSDLL